MPEGINQQQLVYLVILAVAFGLLITEWLRTDIVAVLIVLALSISGLLKPSEALSGFSSEPAIVVAGIFVLSCGLHKTGLSDTMGGWIGRWAGESYNRALAVIMPSVALLSAFTHHVTTTAVMLPVTLKLSRERDIPPSKLLMPLSFAASLGTTITIIGAPAFLIASTVLQQAGRPGLGIFSIAPIGLALSAVGTVFMLLVGRFLLPDRRDGDDPAGRFNLDDYFTELTIVPDSPFLDKSIGEVEADDRFDFSVAGWVRQGRRVPRSTEERLREGDVLLIRTTPDEIATIREEHGLELQPLRQYQPEAPSHNGNEDDAPRLVQAVIAPGSDLVGRTLGDIDFHRRYRTIVVALWRQDGWLRQELSRIRLREGDVLVLQGEDDDLASLADDRSFLMLTPFQGETRLRRRAPLAGAIMLATILAAAFNLLSIEMAALAGAAAMVLSRCLTANQAYRAIDARIFVFIAGAIPLGTAMTKTGTAGLLGGWHPTLLLLALFGVVAVLTQFMSDSATAAIFAPVAAALAQALGRPPEAYVVTVAMASVAAFLTPIGHHGNLLVYGPGRYQFADFTRVGTPLTVLVGLVVAFLAPLIWPA